MKDLIIKDLETFKEICKKFEKENGEKFDKINFKKIKEGYEYMTVFYDCDGYSQPGTICWNKKTGKISWDGFFPDVNIPLENIIKDFIDEEKIYYIPVLRSIKANNSIEAKAIASSHTHPKITNQKVFKSGREIDCSL